MNLPEQFTERIKNILGDESEKYFAELNNSCLVGIRTNLLKTSSKTLEQLLELSDKSPYCSYLYLSNKNKISGNHPLHHAGAFYFQEPSASSVVESLNVQKNDKVLDMCAAPGGKSTQIAAKLGENGFLWSNEAVSNRVQSLISNIERMGIKNAVVSNAMPNVLSQQLKGFFDKVLVDAPCSGEGMIRKDPSILKTWSVENIFACANRQQKILQSAAECVKNGGFLCYSTCTLAPEENEMVIEEFLNNNKNFSLQRINFEFGTNGLTKFAPNTTNINYTRRIFAHQGGEGHFVALMKKSGEAEQNTEFSEPEIITENIKIFKDFYTNTFNNRYNGVAFDLCGKVYIKPNIPAFKNLGIVRMGLYCGEVVKNRFVPSHALFTALGKDSKQQINLPLNSIDLQKFLHGEVINCNENYKGYTAVLVQNIPLGFGKSVNGVLKNHYPKGLRTL